MLRSGMVLVAVLVEDSDQRCRRGFSTPRTGRCQRGDSNESTIVKICREMEAGRDECGEMARALSRTVPSAP